MNHRNPLVLLLLCVAWFTTLIIPIGRAIFPYVGSYLGIWPFDTIEAMVGATLALGVWSLLCG